MAASSVSSFDTCLAFALERIGKQQLKLKREQVASIRHVYDHDGKDVFVWLPTGFGKSICFECLPFVFDFKHNRTVSSSVRMTVLVVSPLVSLMINQVESLRKRGVSAVILSGNEGAERSLLAQEKDLSVSGKYSLLFTSPEAIVGVERWREKFIQPPLSDTVDAVAVDEAHCVSKW